LTVASAVGAALTFVWLGMVLAISFLEAPLKFRAPGVTLQIGLGIGRVVFRALNAVEVVLATAVAVALVSAAPPRPALIAGVIAALALIAQLTVVRPLLSRRADAVLAAGPVAQLPRSRAHHVYVVLELIKVASLIVAGTVLLAG